MTTEEIQIQRLYEALKAAAYYIDRLELVQRRKRVRDMCEAMEHYHRVGPPLIEAYEQTEAQDLFPVYGSREVEEK